MFGSKKKILVLGCSHSMGTWEIVNDKEVVTSHNGWYNYLDTDSKIDIYSASGAGYLNYCKLLQKIDLDDYELVIMQESHEPRFQFTDYEVWEKEKLSKKLTHYHLPGEYKLLNIRGGDNPLQETIFARFGVLQDKNMLKYLQRLGKADHRYFIIQSSVVHINHILQNKNIPGYIIPCGPDEYEMYKDTHTYCKYLNMPNLHTWWGSDHNKFTNIIDGSKYHLNPNGIQDFGLAVNKALTGIINGNT